MNDLTHSKPCKSKDSRHKIELYFFFFFFFETPQGKYFIFLVFNWLGLGGTCVNVGCIPKKLMHRAAVIGKFGVCQTNNKPVGPHFTVRLPWWCLFLWKHLHDTLILHTNADFHSEMLGRGTFIQVILPVIFLFVWLQAVTYISWVTVAA